MKTATKEFSNALEKCCRNNNFFQNVADIKKIIHEDICNEWSFSILSSNSIFCVTDGRRHADQLLVMESFVIKPKYFCGIFVIWYEKLIEMNIDNHHSRREEGSYRNFGVLSSSQNIFVVDRSEYR